MKLYYSKNGKITKWDDLSQLKNGDYLFYEKQFDKTEIEISFPNLLSCRNMFYDSALTSFSGDLSSLVNGTQMFNRCTSLTSFDGKNLKKLAFGQDMFTNCKLSIPSVERIAEQVFDYANMDWYSLPILYKTGQSIPSEEEIQLKDEGLYVYNDGQDNVLELYCIYGRYDKTGKYYKYCEKPGAIYDVTLESLNPGNEIVQRNKITIYVDEGQVSDSTNMARLQAAFNKLYEKGWEVTSNI